MPTQEQVYEAIGTALEYLVYGFAVIGFLGVVALVVVWHGQEPAPQPQARAARCVNSACDAPCKPGARFQRHQGECTK